MHKLQTNPEHIAKEKELIRETREELDWWIAELEAQI
jgi:hypothetical protein